MLGTGDLELDLNSLNDSLASGMSTTMQDLYSYGNLNSASSLSWADDEVENYATMKVQHYLDNLEEYLLTGHLPTERCFQQVEAEQWRTQLVLQFNLQQLLKDSRRQISEDKLRMNPKKELEIQGHSFAHLPSSKYGSTSGYSQFQTPRVRSAYPMKKQTQPIRIRSAYPLKSPPVTNSGLRAGVRSGYSANRSRSPLKHTDYMKMLDDTARLSIQRDATVVGGDAVPFNNKTTLMTATKTVNSQLRRIRLPPSGLPKFTDNIPESAMLPPLIEARNSLRSRAKPKTNPVNSMANFKSATSNFKSSLNSSDSGYLISGRKPTSAAAQHRGMPSLSKPGQHQPYRQTYNNIPASQTTYRTGNNRNDMEVSIELVGTSLSLFEPVVRPVRVPKLRTNF